MQHLDAVAQVAVKQRALEDNLWHLGKVKPDWPLEDAPELGTIAARVGLQAVKGPGLIPTDPRAFVAPARGIEEAFAASDQIKA